MGRTQQLQMEYVGFKDRTFVPQKEQKVWHHAQDEKVTKKILCVLNKIGNAQGATCKVEYLEYQTRNRRRDGTLRRNHYLYVLIVEYQSVDDKLFVHHITSRTGARIGMNFGGDSGCDSGACSGGFCD